MTLSTASSTLFSTLAPAALRRFWLPSPPKVLKNSRIRAMGQAPTANIKMISGQLYQPVLSCPFRPLERLGGSE